MGDIGDYWREHKDYKRRREGAERLGVSLRDYGHWESKLEREDCARKKQQKLDRCTIRCECGKWLLDTNAHNSHKSVKGKKGHGVMDTKEAKQPEEYDYDIVF